MRRRVRTVRNRSTRLAFALVASGLMLGVIAQAAADASRVFRWTDRDGQVHYGDTPSQNATEVNPRVTTASDGAVGAGAKAVNAEECERRRKEVDSYRSAGKVTETNSLGETREFSEAERARLVERAENTARAACGEPQRRSSGEN